MFNDHLQDKITQRKTKLRIADIIKFAEEICIFNPMRELGERQTPEVVCQYGKKIYQSNKQE